MSKGKYKLRYEREGKKGPSHRASVGHDRRSGDVYSKYTGS